MIDDKTSFIRGCDTSRQNEVIRGCDDSRQNEERKVLLALQLRQE